MGKALSQLIDIKTLVNKALCELIENRSAKLGHLRKSKLYQRNIYPKRTETKHTE